MFQEEPHPDIESLSPAESGVEAAVDISSRIIKDLGRIPNLNINTMPDPSPGTLEDRRSDSDKMERNLKNLQMQLPIEDRATGSSRPRPEWGKSGHMGAPENLRGIFSKEPQLFDSGNQDVANLTEYLQSIQDNKGKEPPLPTHPVEEDRTLERLFATAGASKLMEWGAYTAGGMASPKILPAMNALWMASWIAAGHQLRSDIQDQVKQGKSISEIKFPKGSIGDMGGIISALQEKYAKPNSEPQYMSRNRPGDKPLLDMPGGGVPSGNIKGRMLDERGNLSKEVLDNNARLTKIEEGWFRPGGKGYDSEDLLRIRIRQMEYDRKLGGYKRGDYYQGNGEIARLRTRLKELSE